MSKFTEAVKKAFTRTNTPEQLAGIPDEAYEALEKAIGDEIGPEEVEAFLATDEAIAARQAQDVTLLQKAAKDFKGKKPDPDADDEPDDDEDDDGEDYDEDGEDEGAEGDESEDEEDAEKMKDKVAKKAKELFGGGKEGMKKALAALDSYDEPDEYEDAYEDDASGDVVFDSPEDLVKAIVDPILAALGEHVAKQNKEIGKLKKALEEGNQLRKGMAPDLAALARLPVPSGRVPGGRVTVAQRGDDGTPGSVSVDGTELESILQKALGAGFTQPAETSTLRAAVKMGTVTKPLADRIAELKRACGD
jgi:hypothetical protein